jgi:hypothetical protein
MQCKAFGVFDLETRTRCLDVASFVCKQTSTLKLIVVVTTTKHRPRHKNLLSIRLQSNSTTCVRRAPMCLCRSTLIRSAAAMRQASAAWQPMAFRHTMRFRSALLPVKTRKSRCLMSANSIRQSKSSKLCF